MRKNTKYRIIQHTGILTNTLFELQVYAEYSQKWVTACASSFSTDIKHYCQDVNAMNVYNDSKTWTHKRWES